MNPRGSFGASGNPTVCSLTATPDSVAVDNPFLCSLGNQILKNKNNGSLAVNQVSGTPTTQSATCKEDLLPLCLVDHLAASSSTRSSIFIREEVEELSAKAKETTMQCMTQLENAIAESYSARGLGTSMHLMFKYTTALDKGSHPRDTVKQQQQQILQQQQMMQQQFQNHQNRSIQTSSRCGCQSPRNPE